MSAVPQTPTRKRSRTYIVSVLALFLIAAIALGWLVISSLSRNDNRAATTSASTIPTTASPAARTTTSPATSATAAASANPSASPAGTPSSPASSTPATPLPLANRVSWRHECIDDYHFCADFPHFSTAGGQAYERDTNDSATARSGKNVGFSSSVYLTPNQQLCPNRNDQRCQIVGSSDETYFVIIIHSKYHDACQALTAINGGVGRHPVCKTDSRTGKLTVNFHDIYGGPGRTVWHQGKVYYIGSLNGPLTPTRYYKQFADSVVFN